MSDITIDQITEGAVDGEGVFDKLMQAGEAHLTREYKDNRITGKEYSTVYLGMMQAAMAQAMQFVLGEQQADKQADLLAEQILAVIADTTIKNVQSVQDLLNKQEQVTASTANTVRQDAESGKKVLLLQEQTDKTTAEEGLLTQKKVTETAQTIDATGGTMKKNQDLLTAQTNGFARDAEQKLAKIFADVYAINRTTLGSQATVPGGLDDIDITDIVAAAASGIGVTLNETPPP